MSEEEWHSMMEKLCKKMIREQKEEHKKKRIYHPPQPIPNSVLFKKRTKKDEKEVQARRKDALSCSLIFGSPLVIMLKKNNNFTLSLIN